MNAGYLWNLLLDHTSETGRRLIFTSIDVRSLVDITVEPTIANNVINAVLDHPWKKEALISYLNSFSESTNE